MPLLALEDACLAFGHVALLDHVQFQLDAGERVALIGRNGSGKSSLLRVLAGQSTLDDGHLRADSASVIAYVPQEADFALEGDIFDAISGALGEAARLLQDYHATMLALAQHADEAAMERLAHLQQQIEAADAWRLQQRTETLIDQLGLDAQAPLAALSGGTLKRVALARALVQNPDVLLLDEPTNHLDIDGILWLEELIRNFRGAVVVITHDRAFLDRVATRIVALDRGQLGSYPGTYAEYRARRDQELAAEQRAAEKFDKFLAQEEIWIRKGIEARRTRNEGRVRRLHELRRERAARRELQGNVRLALARGEESGQMIVELDRVHKAFGDKTIVRDFSARVLRGDRIGLVGANGAGKTTLLKLFLGELHADSGQIRHGTRQQVAYFDQMRAQLDPERPLTEVISPGSDFVEIGGVRKHVISYLGDFLFPPARARSPVRSLSGGERNRLLLARLFARPANILVLDEPTNDLDTETLELLEELLSDYHGTLFLVSHDRTFLDNVTTQLFAAEGDGLWREYIGGYSDWLAQRPARPAAEARKRAPQPAAAPRTTKPAREPDGRLSWKEKQELAALPERIGQLESEQAALHARLADPEFYRTQGEQAAQVQKRLAALEAELEDALARWETLETRASASAK